MKINSNELINTGTNVNHILSSHMETVFGTNHTMSWSDICAITENMRSNQNKDCTTLFLFTKLLTSFTPFDRINITSTIKEKIPFLTT